ncbi:MAG: hypothetical protein ACHQUC_08990 [Chlamydiales bacterium]
MNLGIHSNPYATYYFGEQIFIFRESFPSTIEVSSYFDSSRSLVELTKSTLKLILTGCTEKITPHARITKLLEEGYIPQFIGNKVKLHQPAARSIEATPCSSLSNPADTISGIPTPNLLQQPAQLAPPDELLKEASSGRIGLLAYLKLRRENPLEAHRFFKEAKVRILREENDFRYLPYIVRLIDLLPREQKFTSIHRKLGNVFNQLQDRSANFHLQQASLSLQEEDMRTYLDYLVKHQDIEDAKLHACKWIDCASSKSLKEGRKVALEVIEKLLRATVCLEKLVELYRRAWKKNPFNIRFPVTKVHWGSSSDDHWGSTSEDDRDSRTHAPFNEESWGSSSGEPWGPSSKDDHSRTRAPFNEESWGSSSGDPWGPSSKDELPSKVVDDFNTEEFKHILKELIEIYEAEKNWQKVETSYELARECFINLYESLFDNKYYYANAVSRRDPQKGGELLYNLALVIPDIVIEALDPIRLGQIQLCISKIDILTSRGFKLPETNRQNLRILSTMLALSKRVKTMWDMIQIQAKSISELQTSNNSLQEPKAHQGTYSGASSPSPTSSLDWGLSPEPN